MLNELIPAFQIASARSGVSMPPWVISVMYLKRTARSTAEITSSRSRRSVGSPPVNVTIIGLKCRAASAKLFSSVAFADDSVFQ
jgi:hypothetical protein